MLKLFTDLIDDIGGCVLFVGVRSIATALTTPVLV